MSSEIHFYENDIRQIESRGLTVPEVREQIAIFRQGIKPIELDRPATLGDGIHFLSSADSQHYESVFRPARFAGRVSKFVPASGAATRMFQSLSIFLREGTKDETFDEFKNRIRDFPFFEGLQNELGKRGKGIADCSDEDLVMAVISQPGLNYAALPKGLIPFHRYENEVRTAFEEHLVEALQYTSDSQGKARIHFTVNKDFEPIIEKHLNQLSGHYEANNQKLEIQFSEQAASSDTIAVTPDFEPFREPSGQLLFRPGGHGALIENLQNLKGDIVFIKNIDNVAPDSKKKEMINYKKGLAGYLVSLQTKIFGFLRILEDGNVAEHGLTPIKEFIDHALGLPVPEHVTTEWLFNRLNRPLRVCGMVRNAGEPGGGPFWVKGDQGELSLQIVESSQVAHGSEEQKAIFAQATHFNPVDLVCGLKDFRGKTFDLRAFVDKDTFFISRKSRGGKDLLALERPGLWNGGMAMWNTVFVEVPMSTFSPVKTVMDLLRPEHQVA